MNTKPPSPPRLSVKSTSDRMPADLGKAAVPAVQDPVVDTMVGRVTAALKPGSNEQVTFYQRPLPQSVTHVQFTDPRSQELLAAAMASGHGHAYFYLANQFLTQDDPAYCGLATLCMILNAASVDPHRPWKGVWRWFDQSMLDCCRSLESIRQVGITMAEFACLARCNTLKAEVKTGRSLAAFREDVKLATQSRGELFVAVSFGRKALGQTGSGHFSAIGAYSGDVSDMVLVFDVARFKYGGSYWITVESMWRAMQTFDDSSGTQRGYCVLRSEQHASDDQFTLVTCDLNKVSAKSLLAATVLQGRPSLQDLKSSPELQPFADCLQLRRIGPDDSVAQMDLTAKHHRLLEVASLRELFFMALHEFAAGEQNQKRAADHTVISAVGLGLEARAVIDGFKTKLSALSSCCVRESH